MRQYYEFQTSLVKCAGCGWQGPGSEASLSEMFEGGAAYVCPRCAQSVRQRASASQVPLKRPACQPAP